MIALLMAHLFFEVSKACAKTVFGHLKVFGITFGYLLMVPHMHDTARI